MADQYKQDLFRGVEDSAHCVGFGADLDRSPAVEWRAD